MAYSAQLFFILIILKTKVPLNAPDIVVVVLLLFYVLGKHLRSCRDGQLT